MSISKSNTIIGDLIFFDNGRDFARINNIVGAKIENNMVTLCIDGYFRGGRVIVYDTYEEVRDYYCTICTKLANLPSGKKIKYNDGTVCIVPKETDLLLLDI